MPRRVSWSVAFAGFILGLVAVLFSSSDREAAAQPKAPAIVPAPQAPTLNTPASSGRESQVGRSNSPSPAPTSPIPPRYC